MPCVSTESLESNTCHCTQGSRVLGEEMQVVAQGARKVSSAPDIACRCMGALRKEIVSHHCRKKRAAARRSVANYARKTGLFQEEVLVVATEDCNQLRRFSGE